MFQEFPKAYGDPKQNGTRENTSSGNGSDKENTINEKSTDTSNRLNNNESQIENVQKSLENPCIGK